mmetsp:Transcript_15946/g.28335  ORF Transcript_15946/g.28335 Transcript_15946/m.28335 type:complete len:339 (+) Transcript_15946:210-1226(+)
MELDLAALVQGGSSRILLVDVNLAITLLGGWVVERHVWLDPAVVVLPFDDLAANRLLGECLARQVSAASPCARGPHAAVAPVPRVPHVAPALAALAHALALALAGTLWLGRFLGKVLVVADLLQSDLGRALLCLLLRGAHVTSPNTGAPFSGQGREPHHGLIAARVLLALIDCLTFLEVSLGNLHHEGVELGLGCNGWILTLFFPLGLLRCQLRRGQYWLHLALLLRWILRCRWRERVHLRRVGLDSLLRCRLLCLLLVQAQVAGVLLTLDAIQLHDGLVLVAKLVRRVHDVLLGDRSLAEPLAEVVQFGLGVHAHGHARRCHGNDDRHCRHPKVPRP